MSRKWRGMVQIDRDIRIRAQAEFRAAIDAALGDQLRNDVDALRRDVARHVRVVGADIVTLRLRHTEQAARIEKKFDDCHILRDAVLV
jgi:hypothetical protein